MSLITSFVGQSENEKKKNEWIEKELKSIPAGWKLLDAGAGALRWKTSCKHLCYVSQDICEYDGKGNGRGLQTGQWDTENIDIICDIVDIPVKDGEFDVVLCSEVLEHLPEPHLAIQEFGRILRPGGGITLDGTF